MILYPSIHVRDGAVARMTRGGDLQQADTLHPDPAGIAKQFEKQGFPWLHVVDLNGAFEGRSAINIKAIENLLDAVTVPVQLTGGMHDLPIVEEWMAKGVARIVMATAAAQNPRLVRDACQKYPGRIAAKIDARDGFVTSTGWSSATTVKALDLALRMEEAGAATLIHANINRDGALSEIDVEAITDLAFALTIPVIASGGVSSLADIAELKSHAEAGISGLILGRALYNGQVEAGAALELANGQV